VNLNRKKRAITLPMMNLLMMGDEMKITERGWAGHFICSDRCVFHRNTLIEHNGYKIIVSTVGAMKNIHSNDEKYEMIGADRYYETMVFHAKWEDPYWDIDVDRSLHFDLPQFSVDTIKRESDYIANEGHERNVEFIANKLFNNEIMYGG
jgi:hypothetical protein